MSRVAEFVDEPQDLLIAVGGPAVFHCTIVATTAVSLQWFHDSQLLPPSQFFLNGTLALQTTQVGDEGTYRCVYTAVNSGQVLERSATLTFACEHTRSYIHTYMCANSLTLSSLTDITPTIARGPESQSVSEGDDVTSSASIMAVCQSPTSTGHMTHWRFPQGTPLG